MPSPAYITDHARWQAVLTRDPLANGHFFFAVKTTGIFCRPSCPARRPHRKNVSFFHHAHAAEQAGFRPCLKCDPLGPSRAEKQATLVAAVCRTIEQAEEMPSLDDLAASVHLSPFHLHRLFKQATGLTPKAYAAARRADRLQKALPRRATVTEAIYEAGFNSPGRFYAASTKMLGMKPRDYQAGAPGATLRFAIGQSSLGPVLVASSEKGVCAIFLGDDPAVLAQTLQKRFPRAHLVGGDAAYEQLVTRVIAVVETPGLGLDLPLDIRGTAFQRRVWQALQAIPPGTTVNYAEIARNIGLPKAFRAVAQACGANAHAVVIPCHRVVRTDGNISGYRWGVERKRELLKREGVSR